MKYINIFFTTLLAIALLFGLACNGKKEETKTSGITEIKEVNPKLRKTREFVLKSDEFNIGVIEPPTLIFEKNGETKLFFRDTGLNQVLISDSMGAIQQAIGKSGDGPKEFRHLTSIGMDEDTLIVYDAVLDMVKKFNLERELINSYQGLLADRVWLRSKRLFLYKDKLVYGIQEADKSSSNNHWESKTIAIYDRAGNLEKLMGEYDPDLIKSHRLYNYSNDLVINNGFAYTTHRTSPTIQKFDLDTGKKISRFGVLSKNYKVSDERPNVTDPREVKNKINVKFSFVGNSFVTDDYFAFYFFNFTEKYFELRNPNDQEHFLNLYNNKEEFVGEITLPFQPIAMDNNNRLYLLEDDNPDNVLIGVYEIKY